MPLARLGAETEAALRALLPEGAYVGNPLDVQTGDGHAVYSALAADPGVGYLVEPWPLPWPDDSARFPWQRAALERIAAIGRAHGTPVAVASLFEQAPTAWARGLEDGGGVSVTPDLELTMAALGRLARPAAREHAGAPDAAPVRGDRTGGGGRRSGGAGRRRAAGGPGRRGGHGGGGGGPGRRAAGTARGQGLARRRRPQGPHRRRPPRAHVARARCAPRARRSPRAPLPPAPSLRPADVRFLVTEMAFGPEVLAGALRDPVAGPTVTVAVGGWAAEAGATLGTIVGAPGVAALEALARGWDAPRLLGARRTADLVAFLERFAAAFAAGALAGYGTVEINPLILAPGGPVIVDALLVEEVR